MSFFEQFFLAGGPIVWFVLVPTSLVTLYLIFERGFYIRSSRLLRKNYTDELAANPKQPDSDNIQRDISARNDLVGKAINDALVNSRGDWLRLRTCAMESLQEQATHLLRKIEWLNLIGGVSPMVGLFGTVFGMIKLFNAIVLSGGQPQPVQLADGISVALVTTFWGLFIAIPALAAHGVFRNKIEVLIGDAVTEVEKTLPLLKQNLQQKEKSNAEPVNFRWVKVPIKTLDFQAGQKAQNTNIVRQKQ